MHQKFRGSGIEIKTNNEYFNTWMEKWWDHSNSEKKWSQFIFSLLITGSAIMELQYTPATPESRARLGNTEQIPMQTIYRLFRDQFGNELKIVQVVDGVFKELDPQFFIHQTINNPDRQAFGKSMFHTLASPRPISGTIDPITGEAINPSRQSIPLLDAQAELQNAEIEIKKKMAKPRLIVGAAGMNRDQMKEVQAEMADPNTDQYIWVFDKPVTSSELQVQAQGKFDEYGANVDAHIDVGTIFASNVIKNPQGFSYSGGQTPLDVLDQRMIDLQSELAETIKDELLKPLAESWGFQDFDAMEAEVTFTPIMKRLTMEDIRGLDPEAVSKKEIREMYKALNIPLDDNLWEEEQQELKQDKQDEKNIQMQSAMMGLPPTDGAVGAASPFDGKSFDDDDDKPDPSDAGTTKAPETPKVEQPQTNNDVPKPEGLTTPQPTKKPRGETFVSRVIKMIASESDMSDDEKLYALRALERIPLPPKAGDNANSSSDLYVSQGIDDEEGKPEITDPVIRKEYGLDQDESELPPSAPATMAHVGDKQNLNPSDNTQGRFTNGMDDGIPQIPEVSEEEYMQHLEASDSTGNAYQGGTGNDGINQDSDGSFKDPIDANNDMERTPETGNTDNPMPHAGPNQEPLVNNPNDLTLNVTGGSDATPDNTNDQILGSPDGDENPIVPSEGFQPDYDEEELKKKIDRQNINGEAINPNVKGIPLADELGKDIIEGEDPLTTGTSEDPHPELNQPQKQQVRLDDSPLQDPSANKGNINGVNPSRDYDNTTEEQITPLANDGDENPTDMVPPFDKDSQMVGDSSQVRLQDEEITGEPQDPLLPNDSNNVLDNSGLNMKPEVGYPQVSEDDYMKKVQDGSNPLEELGEPLEDGMIIKPEDIQQHDGGLGGTPITPEGMTAHDQDPNTLNDPTDSGIDEEQIDPNILHFDPVQGGNYTDQTDEQGNDVPDLRFDQTPTSDEEQPIVELEYEIVTKEEYDQHLDTSKGQIQDPMSEDQFNQELDSQSIDPNAPNPFDQETPANDVPTTDTKQGEPDTSTPTDGNISGSDGEKEDSEIPPSAEPKAEPPAKDEEKPKKSPKKKDDGEKPTPKDESLPSENSEKPEKDEKTLGNEEPDRADLEEIPPTKGDVDDIINREHELMGKGVPEDEIHDILVDEFGEDEVPEQENDDDKS